MSTTSRSPARWGGRLLLATLFVALAVAAVQRPSASWSVEEATTLLEAASLAHDGDLTFDGRDVERFRAREWSPETRIALGFDADGTHYFERPPFYPLLAAPFERLLPGRGALLLNVLLLAVAAWAAIRYLAPIGFGRGAGAAWLVAALVFGSATFATALQARADALVVAAAVVAFALIWQRGDGLGRLAAGDLPEMYPDRRTGALGGRRAGSVPRWLLAGSLLGVAGAHHPILLLLLPPLIFGVPRGSRAAALPLAVVGLVVALTTCWLAGALWTDLVAAPKLVASGDSLASLAERGASPVAGVAQRPVWPPRVDPGLFAHNVVYLLAGRHVGLLVYFLPGLLLLPLGWGAPPLRRIALAGLSAAVLLLIFFPFNFAGGPGAGNRWLLPFYAVAWLTPRRRVGIPSAIGCLAAGALVTVPLWWGDSPPAAGPASPLLERLPFETTQRNVPVAAEMVRAGVRVRAASAAISTGEGDRPWVLAADGRGQLVVASERPLASLTLELGPEARGEPRLGGAELAQLIYRPDGGVAFQLDPGRGLEHPVWWSDRDQIFYRVAFAMPETAVALPFAVSVESAGD